MCAWGWSLPLSYQCGIQRNNAIPFAFMILNTAVIEEEELQLNTPRV